MTIKELIEHFYDSGIFHMRLFTSTTVEHIGDFKNDSIGINMYMNRKIVYWRFGKSDRSLDLFVKEENEECK